MHYQIARNRLNSGMKHTKIKQNINISTIATIINFLPFSFEWKIQ